MTQSVLLEGFRNSTNERTTRAREEFYTPIDGVTVPLLVHRVWALVIPSLGAWPTPLWKCWLKAVEHDALNMWVVHVLPP